ncbi:MAG: lipoyl(octanoyl) transferase LipB [Bacteroidota bacterium]
MNLKNRPISVKKWGLIDYQTAWEQQEVLLNEIIVLKIANRKLDKLSQKPTPSYLLFCEHPPVYTLGKSGSSVHLLASKAVLQEQGVALVYTNRGGSITYHGPGQVMLYPILDLENYFTDIHRYLRLLEEAVIATLQNFGLNGGRVAGFTGVWINYEVRQQARKICAIGVKISQWVTMHGLALNVNPDLSYFDYIIPCGIPDSIVTSMAAELGWQPDMEAVADRLQGHMVRLLSDGSN